MKICFCLLLNILYMSKPIWTQFGCNQKNGPTEGHKTHRGILVDDNWLKIDDIYHLSVSMWHINWSGLIWLGKKNIRLTPTALSFVRVHFLYVQLGAILVMHINVSGKKNMETDLLVKDINKQKMINIQSNIKC